MVVAAGAGAGAAAASAAGLASSAGFAASAAGAAGAASVVVVAGAAAAAGAAGVSSFLGSSAGLEASAVVAGAANHIQTSGHCWGGVIVRVGGLTSRCGLGLGWLRGGSSSSRSCLRWLGRLRRLVGWLGCLTRLGLGLLVLLLEDGLELGLQVVERIWCCGRAWRLAVAQRHRGSLEVQKQ